MGIFSSKTFDPSTDLSDLTGKVVIVTGGNTGIGYATIKHLARRGAKVYMASRSEEKMAAALEKLKGDGVEKGEVLSLKLDLGDSRKAKAAAEEFLTRENRLDILINNAAWLTGPYEKTVDGVVDSMMTNHISPFIFTQTLLPLLKRTAEEPGADVRIVNLASIGHRMITPDEAHYRNMDDINQEFAQALLPTFKRYGFTKLANVLWTKELQRRFDIEDTTIIAISVHPGSVNTFADKLPSVIRPLGAVIMKYFFKSPDEGAYNSVIAAASPRVRQYPEMYKGAYIEGDNGNLAKPSKAAENPETATELWATTEEFLTSIKLQ